MAALSGLCPEFRHRNQAWRDPAYNIENVPGRDLPGPPQGKEEEYRHMCKVSEEKRVTSSQTEQIHVVVPQHLNGRGTLFGGQLAFWIDEVGGVTASRYCRCTVTTAAIDNLRFREPVFQNELLVLLGRVTFTGETSMEVRVDSFAENLSGQRRLINTAFVIMVALGEDGRPCTVPKLTPRTPEEEREFAAGRQRKLFRTRMSQELYE